MTQAPVLQLPDSIKEFVIEVGSGTDAIRPSNFLPALGQKNQALG